MKKTQDKYNEIMDKVILSNEEKNKIKNNIVNREVKPIYKNAYIALAIIAIIFTMGITVNALVKHYSVIRNEEYKKEAIFNGYVDKDYKSDLFVKNNTYEIEEIENKLELKILKNKYVETNLYSINNITVKNNNISKINFWLSKANNNINIGFEVNTDKNEYSEFSVSGNAEMKTYMIKKLNTEALIYETKNEYAGFILANFEYEGLIYSVEIDKINYSIDKLYDILESFYK